MHELIAVTDRNLGDGLVATVNARDLHAFLEVGKDFATWVKSRIEQYGFVENADFVTFEAAPQNGGAGNRGIRIEYALTLDMAKELAMVERNDKGKQARQYFIECERRAKAGPVIPQSLPEALRLAADLAEQKAIAEAALAAAKPKADALDRIATETAGAVCLRIAAKLLQMPERRFLQFANRKGFIFRNHHSRTWQGYAEKAKAGLLELKLTLVRSSDGSEKTVEQVLFTRAGLAKIAELVERERAA